MKQKATLNKSRTDFNGLKTLADQKIDFSDIPEISPSKFAKGFVRHGLKPVCAKRQLTLRIDHDVQEWFKAQTLGYQTCINTLLRAYKEAHKA
jgi:uncharacterized protein (DUF4415 family)